MTISKDALDAAKTAHGEVHVLTSGDVQIAIKRPRRGDYQRYRAAVADSAKRPTAMEDLVRSLVVIPEREAFGEMLEELPALCEEFAEPVLKLMGMSGTADAKKY